MIGLLSIAAAGLGKSLAAITKGAVTVVRSMTTGTGGSFTNAVVVESVNSATIKADIAMVKATNAVTGTVLDILA